jgi:hypothetical protein
VAAAAHAFDSGSIAANSSWTCVASKAGEYACGCTFQIDLAESDLYEFGGSHCDAVVTSVLAKLSR